MMTLVVPLDTSTHSRAVLPYVERVFDPSRWRLRLVHVTARPPLPAPVVPGAVPGLATVPADVGMLGRSPAPPPSAATEPHGGFTSQRFDAERDRLMERLEPDARELRGLGYAVTSDVLLGDDPAQELAEYVDDCSADAVAMATHGRTGLGRFLRGSVAEDVLHTVTVPVFLVRASERPAGAQADPAPLDDGRPGA